MPELPEVETIKRVLEPQLQGLTVENISLRRPEIISHPDEGQFRRQLTGRTISGMARRGKFLIIQFNEGQRLILHLRMTGCLLLSPADYPEEKHTHLIFHLNNGSELRFSDTRRFGRFWLLQKDEKDTYSGIQKLGKEPFAPDFTADYLKSCLCRRKKSLKECLLEQRVVAGIGNIYSDEILFASKLKPTRAANTLSDAEWQRLAKNIPRLLSYFIEKNQITPEEYLKTKGKDYRNTPFLQVYGKEGKPCPVCGQPLRRAVIGGRSSVFCPGCQGDEE